MAELLRPPRSGVHRLRGRGGRTTPPSSARRLVAPPPAGMLGVALGSSAAAEHRHSRGQRHRRAGFRARCRRFSAIATPTPRSCRGRDGSERRARQPAAAVWRNAVCRCRGSRRAARRQIRRGVEEPLPPTASACAGWPLWPACHPDVVPWVCGMLGASSWSAWSGRRRGRRGQRRGAGGGDALRRDHVLNTDSWHPRSLPGSFGSFFLSGHRARVLAPREQQGGRWLTREHGRESIAARARFETLRVGASRTPRCRARGALHRRETTPQVGRCQQARRAHDSAPGGA